MGTKATIAVIAALSLGACQHDDPQGLPYFGGKDNFGESTRMTMAAQVVDPVPVYETTVPETSAEHAGQAAERYRTDKVKRPDRTRTTDVNAGGSGGGQQN